MYYRSLYIVVGGFFAGIIIRSFFVVHASILLLLLVVSIVCLVLVVLDRGRVVLITTFLICISVIVGMFRLSVADTKADTMLMQHVNEPVVLVGTIVQEPDMRDRYVGVTLQVVSLSVGNAMTGVNERMLIRAQRYSSVTYGDTVEVSGTFELPETIESDDGRVFDYISYLKKDGIHFVMSYPSVKIIKKGGHVSIHTTLFGLKRRFLDALQNIVPEPEVSLLAGLVVGAKESLGKDLLDTFRAAGVMHMVVLSGYNISVIVQAVMCVLQFLPRVLWLGSGGIFIVLFVMLTGASASTVRAGIMAGMVLLAGSTGRKVDAIRALAIAACIMVFINPYILAFDPSFQLSCLATIGLVVGVPFIERMVRFIPKTLGLREALTSTLAAELFVLPMILFQTGQFSVIGPLVNMLVLPLIPFTMLVGFIAGLLGMISSVIALPFAGVVYILLHYELFIIEKAGMLPLASAHIPAFPLWMVVVGYAALSTGVLFLRARSQNDQQQASS